MAGKIRALIVRSVQSICTYFMYEDDSEWVLVCHQCWEQVSQDNPFYVYGGTRMAGKK